MGDGNGVKAEQGFWEEAVVYKAGAPSDALRSDRVSQSRTGSRSGLGLLLNVFKQACSHQDTCFAAKAPHGLVTTIPPTSPQWIGCSIARR